jgi:hypothetical protein
MGTMEEEMEEESELNDRADGTFRATVNSTYLYG